MKWFLCALCCLTEGLSVLRAQIMPDSSVQICAYWTPGDKYAYEAREEKFKIDDQGDTTLVYRQSERRVFEILSQTKDRYKIRLTYGDYMTTDKEASWCTMRSCRPRGLVSLSSRRMKPVRCLVSRTSKRWSHRPRRLSNPP